MYLLICSYKSLFHYINLMCNLLVQTLYNIYIKEKNKEIFTNTETLIHECKSNFSYLEDDFEDAILLYADSIFNKFSNIFKYINKNNYEYKYNEPPTNTTVTYAMPREKGIYIPPTEKNQFTTINRISGVNDLSPYDDKLNDINIKEPLFSNKYMKNIIRKNVDTQKNMNMDLEKIQENTKNTFQNRNRINIYNVYGNSIYSNIYDIQSYLKFKYNYIHSLILYKSKSRINYIKFLFYFLPYIINLSINIITTLYVLVSVYYYNNLIPLASTYDMANVHTLGIYNFKGLYYILFIFVTNFTFFLFVLFLSKFNTIYLFLRQIYSHCKYESIFYCDSIMNQIYEQYIIEEVAKRICDSANVSNKRSTGYQRETTEREIKKETEKKTQTLEINKCPCKNDASPTKTPAKEKPSYVSKYANDTNMFKLDVEKNWQTTGVGKEYPTHNIKNIQSESVAPCSKCFPFAPKCQHVKTASSSSNVGKHKDSDNNYVVRISNPVTHISVKRNKEGILENKCNPHEINSSANTANYSKKIKKNKIFYVDSDVPNINENRRSFHFDLNTKRISSD